MAEVRSVSSTGGHKGVKAQAYNSIPPNALIELAKLYGIGSKKYDDHNFRRGYEWRKSYASLQRHANLFWSGENIDLEMRVSHLASVAWHAFTLTEFFYTCQNYDDRPVKPAVVEHGFDELGVIGERLFPASHQDTAERFDDEIEPRFDLIPLRPLADLAKFYGDEQGIPVTSVGHLWSDDYTKIQEYANLFWAGQNFNAVSGFLNTIHIAHHAMNLIELTKRFTEFDDRLIQGAAPIGFDSFPA